MVSHYRLEEAVGGGSMGSVYRAHDTGLDCPVALKFLRPEMADDSVSVERFLLEARLAASLQHRHVCTIHGIDRDGDGTWYIAMRWYGGGTLKRRLADGPLPARDALRYAHEAALGLGCAHRHGIVHRDVKPANIILDDEGEVKILDFGVARLLETERQTRAGGLIGTVGYLSPEQARGEEPTPRSDVWSVGVVLYELLTGRLPFQGDYEAALLYSIVHGEPAPLPDGADPLLDRCRPIIARCLAKDPQQRYATGDDLAAALAGVRSTEAAAAAVPAVSSPPTRRVRWMAAGATVLLVALLLFVRWGPQLLARVGLAEAAPDTRGVAILPVSFADGDEDAVALGAGLGWFLADRLSRLERRTDAFWVVPPGDVLQQGVATAGDAERRFGVRRSFQGHGRLAGGTLTVDLTYFDARTGAHASRRFSDDTANLRTWQHDLPIWAAGVLDADLVRSDPPEMARGCTTVPEAFLAWLRGVGCVWRADGEDLLGRGVDNLAAAVRQDSSFACARADYGWAGLRLAGDAAPDSGRTLLALLRSAAQLDRTAVWPRLYLAFHEQRRGRTAAALAHYDSVLAIDAVNGAALPGKARVLAGMGRTDEASALFVRALDARPDYAPLLLAAGRFWYRAADFDRAHEVLARAARITPDDHAALSMLGAVCWELGDLQAAEEAFHASAALQPSFAVYSNMGTMAYYQERYADAAGFYRRALAHGQTHTAWKHLAEAWRWLPGYADSSRMAYGRAAALARAAVDAGGAGWELKAELATYCSALADTAAAGILIGDLEAAAAELGNEEMFLLAVAHEDLGAREAALRWLERAFTAGLPAQRPEHYPGFRNLRADARYRALITRYGGPS